MQEVFENPSQIEALVKQKYGFPDFIMMENAALAIKNLLLQIKSESKTPDAVMPCLILCGKGNNGGDGYALARLIMGEFEPLIFCLEEPTAKEAKIQYELCKKLGVKFISKKALFYLVNSAPLFIVDCLYGTGFKGELSPDVLKIIQTVNNVKAVRIACDIPTALTFNANYTVTMGEHKLSLFSDKAKQTCGKIIVASLGMDRTLFEKTAPAPAASLITPQDINLPLRKNKAVHKGTYGHTAVFAGEKSGAAIICATAAMNFGSGLTTIIKQKKSNLSQFKISPELMISDNIPSKTTCVVLGPGSDFLQPETAAILEAWWFDKKTKAPAAVFDAGMFGNETFITLLSKLCTRKDSRIVLTPHLAELVRFCSLPQNKQLGLDSISVEDLANSPEIKIKAGNAITKQFTGTAVVIKSANTFITTGTTAQNSQPQTFIITDGAQSLAKGGSGDVLAGMIASLLAQGYTTKDAAITACEVHALTSKRIGEQAYDLSPMRIIQTINSLD